MTLKQMVVFIGRLIKQMVVLLLVSIPLQVIGSGLVGIYLVLVPTCKRLPTYLKWFDGADQYIGRNTEVYDQVMASNIWTKYCWLCWRNPTNYFNYTVLGFKIKLRNIDWSNSYEEGDPEVGDSTGDHFGYFYGQIQDFDGHVYYEYYTIIKWSDTKCFRFRMGHKLGQLDKMKDGEWVQDVFVIQPYRSYNGI